MDDPLSSTKGVMVTPSGRTVWIRTVLIHDSNFKLQASRARNLATYLSGVLTGRSRVAGSNRSRAWDAEKCRSHVSVFVCVCRAGPDRVSGDSKAPCDHHLPPPRVHDPLPSLFQNNRVALSGFPCHLLNDEIEDEYNMLLDALAMSSIRCQQVVVE